MILSCIHVYWWVSSSVYIPFYLALLKPLVFCLGYVHLQSLPLCDSLEERYCKALQFLHEGTFMFFSFILSINVRILARRMINTVWFLQKGLAVVAISSNSVVTHPQVCVCDSLMLVLIVEIRFFMRFFFLDFTGWARVHGRRCKSFQVSISLLIWWGIFYLFFFSIVSWLYSCSHLFMTFFSLLPSVTRGCKGIWSCLYTWVFLV